MAVRSIAPIARDAVSLLGSEIRAGRLERGWSLRELAERTGVSTATIVKVERGDLGVAIGTAMDCAALVGVPLFYDDAGRVRHEAERARAAVVGRRPRRAAAPDPSELDF
jgi:transcriptional regulator with XRE-family HTH domain